jgi:hypothetical protein
LFALEIHLYRNTQIGSSGPSNYSAISVKCLAQGNNGLPLTEFKPMLLAILEITSLNFKVINFRKKYNLLSIRTFKWLANWIIILTT